MENRINRECGEEIIAQEGEPIAEKAKKSGSLQSRRTRTRAQANRQRLTFGGRQDSSSLCQVGHCFPPIVPHVRNLRSGHCARA